MSSSNLSLKDLLLYDSGSCSSSGFKSFPRKPCMQKLNETNAIQKTSNLYNVKTLPKSISALQAMIKLFKNFQFSTMKSPSALPRSLSRRLLSRRSSCKKKQKESNITVRVRDILRWKSSRDLIQENSTPFDFNGDDDLHGEKFLLFQSCVGRDSIEGAKGNVGPKEELSCEDQELNSPISVLDFQSDENEEQVTSFERNLANMERAKEKVMKKIRRLESLAKMDSSELGYLMTAEQSTSSCDDTEDEETEKAYTEEHDWIEEKARHLLICVKETFIIEALEGVCMDQLLLDYFREELEGRASQSENYKDDEKMILMAKAWMLGQGNWTFERNGEYGIRDIEKEWGKVNVEKEELALEVESRIFHSLVDDMLLNLLECYT